MASTTYAVASRPSARQRVRSVTGLSSSPLQPLRAAAGPRRRVEPRLAPEQQQREERDQQGERRADQGVRERDRQVLAAADPVGEQLAGVHCTSSWSSSSSLSWVSTSKTPVWSAVKLDRDRLPAATGFSMS